MAIHTLRQQTAYTSRFLEKHGGADSYVEVNEADRIIGMAVAIIDGMRKSEGYGSGGTESTTSESEESQASKTSKQADAIEEVSDTDVLFGQGPRIFQLEGNKRFRALIRKFYSEAGER